jgi:hypothetical protein
MSLESASAAFVGDADGDRARDGAFALLVDSDAQALDIFDEQGPLWRINSALDVGRRLVELRFQQLVSGTSHSRTSLLDDRDGLLAIGRSVRVPRGANCDCSRPFLVVAQRSRLDSR